MDFSPKGFNTIGKYLNCHNHNFSRLYMNLKCESIFNINIIKLKKYPCYHKVQWESHFKI